MNVSARKDQLPGSEELSPEREAAAKSVGGWVQQFARTLKNCRLYDAQNPAVARLRQDLLISLQRLLDEQGAVCLRFNSNDVLFDEVSLYPARSREDNLALPFYRDGIRGLVLAPGVEADELDALLAALIQVTGQVQAEDDLVTLLWEAHLTHIEVDYVPSEADVGGAGAGPEGAVLPWPSAAIHEDETDKPAEPEPAAAPQEEEDTGGSSRSDDWHVSEQTAEIEAGFAELETIAAGEVERFRSEYEEEHRASPVTAALAVSHAYLAAGANADDIVELARFLPRVLRQAFVQGGWREAGEALSLLEQCGNPEWSVNTFAQELLQPISVSGMKERLEPQEPAQVADFITFVRRLGDPALDLLNLLIAEIQNPRHQRALSEAVIEQCRSNPERLAPWLSDPRGYVVRNTVQMLGTIGGNTIVGLLDAVVHHPEPRVRLEVAAALRHVEAQAAQPLLVRMLEGADTRMFCTVLHQLAQARDPGVARLLLGHLTHADFDRRPADEKRAIFSALASAGGDEVIPELEAELHRGSWFSRALDAHRQAVARCLARIGSPLAREVLERGAQSRRAPIRRACEDVLARFGHHD